MTSRISHILAMCGLFCLLVLAASAQAQEKTGKELFLGHKCNSCHTVEAQGITKGEADAGEAEEAEGEPAAASEEETIPDLSNVGGKKYDASTLDQYLRKKGTIGDKKHRKRFKGTDDERKVLVDWLLTLKQEKAAGK